MTKDTKTKEDSKVPKASKVSKKPKLKCGIANMPVARLKKILVASADETNKMAMSWHDDARGMMDLGFSSLYTGQVRNKLSAIKKVNETLDELITILKKLNSHPDTYWISVSETYFTRDQVRIINGILETYEREGITAHGYV